MEAKGQDKSTRLRSEVRRSFTPHLGKSSEQPEGPHVGRRSLGFGFLFLALGVFFTLGVIFCFYALKSPSAFPILSNPLKDLLARSAQPATLDEQKTQTDLLARTLHMMGPLTELKTSVIKPGSGPTVAKGQRVTVHATGSVLQADGSAKKFWSTKDPGQQVSLGRSSGLCDSRE